VTVEVLLQAAPGFGDGLPVKDRVTRQGPGGPGEADQVAALEQGLQGCPRRPRRDPGDRLGKRRRGEAPRQGGPRQLAAA